MVNSMITCQVQQRADDHAIKHFNQYENLQEVLLKVCKNWEWSVFVLN